MFPKIGVPQNGWFIMENPIKIDDLEGKPIFLETPISFKPKKKAALQKRLARLPSLRRHFINLLWRTLAIAQLPGVVHTGVKCSNLPKTNGFLVRGARCLCFVTRNPRKTKNINKQLYHQFILVKKKTSETELVALRFVAKKKAAFGSESFFGNPKTCSAWLTQRTLFWPLAAYRPGSARPGAWGIWTTTGFLERLNEENHTQQTKGWKLRSWKNDDFFHEMSFSTKVPRQFSISGKAHVTVFWTRPWQHHRSLCQKPIWPWCNWQKIKRLNHQVGSQSWPFHPLGGHWEKPLKGSRFHHPKKVTKNGQALKDFLTFSSKQSAFKSRRQAA